MRKEKFYEFNGMVRGSIFINTCMIESFYKQEEGSEISTSSGLFYQVKETTSEIFEILYKINEKDK